MPSSCNITFVTGSRAEFGLMTPVLRAIQSDKRLNLQIIATGMHLDRAHGRTVNQIKKDGWPLSATVPWKPAGVNKTQLARATGQASAALATIYEKLKSDIVLLVGDRVEAFAAASAAHLSGRIVAHVHGGDRALGQVDDALRHSISKLAHIHFAATQDSAGRLLKLGEDKWRIKLVGSPGIDGILKEALPYNCLWPITLVLCRQRYALFVLHPVQDDEQAEFERASLLLRACVATGFEEVVCVHPNNDPGAAGIARAIKLFEKQDPLKVKMALSYGRDDYLGLLRDAAVLVGNSSSGIIEAASFGTPVLDIGDRQKGRLRGENVTSVPFRQAAIQSALKKIWNAGAPIRYRRHNIYGRGRTGAAIARHLAATDFTPKWRQKLIAY